MFDGLANLLKNIDGIYARLPLGFFGVISLSGILFLALTYLFDQSYGMAQFRENYGAWIIAGTVFAICATGQKCIRPFLWWREKQRVYKAASNNLEKLNKNQISILKLCLDENRRSLSLEPQWRDELGRMIELGFLRITQTVNFRTISRVEIPDNIWNFLHKSSVRKQIESKSGKAFIQPKGA